MVFSVPYIQLLVGCIYRQIWTLLTGVVYQGYTLAPLQQVPIRPLIARVVWNRVNGKYGASRQGSLIIRDSLAAVDNAIAAPATVQKMSFLSPKPAW